MLKVSNGAKLFLRPLKGQICLISYKESKYTDNAEFI